MDINDKRKRCRTKIVDLQPGDLFYFVGGNVQGLHMKIQKAVEVTEVTYGYVRLLCGTYYPEKWNPRTYKGAEVIKVEEAELNILD